MNLGGKDASLVSRIRSEHAAENVAYKDQQAIGAPKFPVDGLLCPLPYVQFVAARRVTPSFDGPSAYIAAQAFLPKS